MAPHAISWSRSGVRTAFRTILSTATASHRNRGQAAVQHLRDTYDANDENDQAGALNRLMASHIDARADLSENDVRHQYDNMMIAIADIVRSGGRSARPSETLLISMFENSLPASYTTVRLRSAARTPLEAPYFGCIL